MGTSHPLSVGSNNHAIVANPNATGAPYADIAARDADTAFQITTNINKVVKVTSPNSYFILSSIGPVVWVEMSSTGFDEFIELTDTPSSYSGQAGKVVEVNAGETAVEFGQILTVLGTPTFAQLNIDNLRLDGNTLSTTDTNGDLLISPDGTGQVDFEASVLIGIAQLNVDNIRIDGNTISTVDTNGNLLISPDGTGSVDFEASTLIDIAQLNVDNLRFDGTTISTETGNADINLSPNGTGNVNMGGSIVEGIIQLNVDNLRLDGNTLSSTDTNGNILIIPNGAGLVQVAGISFDGVGSLLNLTSGQDLVFDTTGAANVNVANNKITNVGTPTAGSADAANTFYVDNADALKVTGPGSATDNALVRFDLATGKLVQNSVAILTDAGILSGLTQLNVDNIRIDGNIISTTDTNGNLTLSPDGTGQIFATTKFEVSGSIRTTSGVGAFTELGAVDSGSEGGQLNFKGAGSNNDWFVDLFNVRMRTITSSAVANVHEFFNSGSGTMGMVVKDFFAVGEGTTTFLHTMTVRGSLGLLLTESPVNVNSGKETFIGITDTAAVRTVTLRTADTVKDRVYIIKDQSFNAGTNKISVVTEGAQNIDGDSSGIDIIVDGGKLRVYCNGTDWFSW